YQDVPEVVDYLREVREDIVEHLDDFREKEGEPPEVQRRRLRRYQVNVAVDHSGRQGAPVILESNPTYPNLFGRIEKEAQMGMLTTDFTLIRCGSLQQAGG